MLPPNKPTTHRHKRRHQLSKHALSRGSNATKKLKKSGDDMSRGGNRLVGDDMSHTSRSTRPNGVSIVSSTPKRDDVMSRGGDDMSRNFWEYEYQPREVLDVMSHTSHSTRPNNGPTVSSTTSKRDYIMFRDGDDMSRNFWGCLDEQEEHQPPIFSAVSRQPGPFVDASTTATSLGVDLLSPLTSAASNKSDALDSLKQEFSLELQKLQRKFSAKIASLSVPSKSQGSVDGNELPSSIAQRDSVDSNDEDDLDDEESSDEDDESEEDDEDSHADRSAVKRPSFRLIDDDESSDEEEFDEDEGNDAGDLHGVRDDGRLGAAEAIVYRTLLERHCTTTDSIHSCGLVFLESHDGKPMKKGASTKGLFKKACRAHFLFFGEHQSYHLADGMHPHGAMNFADFHRHTQYLDRKSAVLYVYPYTPGSTFKNSSITVVNDAKAAKNVNWSKVKKSLDDSKANEFATDGRHGLSNARDFGFCGDQSSSRKQSSTGHSEPNWKKGTKQKHIRRFFVQLSDLARSSDPVWCPGVLQSDRFSESIDKKNVLHCLRLGRMDPTTLMSFHSDNNPRSRPDVFCLSHLVNGVRYAVNGQGKPSVLHALDRVEESKDLTLDLKRMYKDAGDDRQGIGVNMFNGHRFHCFGHRLTASKCNMDMESFVLPTLFGVAELADAWRLNYEEITSVQIAADFVPNTKYFFRIACSILADTPYDDIPSCFRGVQLGRLLALISRQLKDDYLHKTYQRYANYSPPPIPSSPEWDRLVRLHSRLQLHVFRSYSDVTESKQGQVYPEVKKIFQESIHLIGHLATEHMILEKACLGLLPAWMRGASTFSDADCHYLEDFRMRYPHMQKSFKGDKLMRFVKSTAKGMEQTFGTFFSVRKIENCLCKVYRYLANNDSAFFNVQYATDPLVRFPSKKTCELVLKNGTVQVLEGPYLLLGFPYGNGILPLVKIASLLNLHNTLPSKKMMMDFDFPIELRKPAVGIEAQFQLRVQKNHLIRDEARRQLARLTFKP